MGHPRALLESLFYDKKIVTDDFVLQVFTDHVHNNDGYTIQRTLAEFSTPQFEDAKLASIHAPTSVLWGGQDELIPVASGEKLHDGIAGTKLVVFEKCGHVPEIEKPPDSTRLWSNFSGSSRAALGLTTVITRLSAPIVRLTWN
jgi:pimeloyl-ACP methyl ester carboxylesterase